jgi:phosphatidate cytidylyltransferase
MLKERLLVILFLLPVGVLLIVFGGYPFDLFMAIILAMSGWEYVQLFKKGGWQPGTYLVVGGTAIISIARAFLQFRYGGTIISVLVLAAMAYHLFKYEKGRDEAAIDFCITLGGILYLGWLGSYVISLRSLDNGMWWVMFILPTVWLVDAGAYLIGSRLGKRPLAPRLSPKKTWEGYWGGAICGVVGGMALAALWGMRFPALTLDKGALVGLVMGVLTPLGDLGESMFKRMAHVKDSSNILPGHGGIFDRIDSWIWAAVLGYFLITGFWQF